MCASLLRIGSIALVLLAGCGGKAATKSGASDAPAPARWQSYAHVERVLDLAGPRPDGSLVVAGAGKLFLLSPTGSVTPYAPAYQSPGGEEPYIAMPSQGHRGCSFGAGTVYAIRLQDPGRGITAITAAGAVHPFTMVTASGLIDGIAFDETGRFAYRLLVTVNHGKTSTVDAISCGGTITQITRNAPRVEGGIAVAPASFGRFAGDLIAPDETGGRIFAITPKGKSVLVARSGLPHGGDIGVESEGFVPADRPASALLADRLTPGNRHPGDDVVLRLAVASAGARPGDLLVATEGGALTDLVRCGPTRCQVREVAAGPTEAHAEGHLAFAR
jgi:hypothetical protein